MSTTISETKTKISVGIQPFGIEADHPRNADLMIQSIPGCRLRGAVVASKGTIVNHDSETGDSVISPDQAMYLGNYPQIPGMQLHVDPAKCTYSIIDPLYDDEKLCERIKATAKRLCGIHMERKLRGVAPQKGKLDPHRMKTLCREMFNIVQAGEGKTVKGVLPTMEDIDSLPGKYLLNPGSRIFNSQPTFEEDFPVWYDNLVKSGG